MRSFATLLTALSLPLYGFAAHHGEHVRRHADVAVRARGDLAERGGSRLTYYDITTGITACGGRYSASNYVVALNQAQWDGGSHCGDSIALSYNGVTITVQIVDLCPGCPYQGLDCTEGVFEKLAGSLNAGVLDGDWSFGNSGSGASPKEDPTTTTTPKYTPPPTTSTHVYTPSPTPHTTSTPPPPSSSSRSTSLTSSSVPTSSPTSTYQPHTSSTPTSTSTSSSYSSVPSGALAQPAGTINDDGETENLESLFNLVIAFGDVILASQS